MLGLMLAAELIMFLSVLIAKFPVELTMFPRIQSLFVSSSMFLVKLIVAVIMTFG